LVDDRSQGSIAQTTFFCELLIIAEGSNLRTQGINSFGKVLAIRLADQIEEGAPKARALCMVARTFPQHRELFSNRNLTKLAELPEDTKSEMLAMLKAAIV